MNWLILLLFCIVSIYSFIELYFCPNWPPQSLCLTLLFLPLYLSNWYVFLNLPHCLSDCIFPYHFFCTLRASHSLPPPCTKASATMPTPWHNSVFLAASTHFLLQAPASETGHSPCRTLVQESVLFLQSLANFTKPKTLLILMKKSSVI